MRETQVSEGTVTSPQGEYDSLRYVSSESPCPYLPGRSARSEAYFLATLDGATYERLLGSGFRRSGRVLYRPRCRGCRACQSLRVPVESFRPTRSMRRVWRRNTDVRVEIGGPSATPEKFSIFRRYLNVQHDGSMSRRYESFAEFLYDSPTDTLEVGYSLGGRLIGVSLVDRCPGGLSSVYMYFDPDFADRSLGTYSVLWEIDWCRRQGLPHYYLGFYVAGSETMSYKSRFRPNEILGGNGHWEAFAK